MLPTYTIEIIILCIFDTFLTVNLIFNAPKDANLRFWKIGQTIALLVRHLHYNIEKVYTLGISGGGFSIRYKKAINQQAM